MSLYNFYFILFIIMKNIPYDLQTLKLSFFFNISFSDLEMYLHEWYLYFIFH